MSEVTETYRATIEFTATDDTAAKDKVAQIEAQGTFIALGAAGVENSHVIALRRVEQKVSPTWKTVKVD